MSFLLSLQSVTKSFGPRPLFRNISFGVEEGERLGLIGPNGSGKSTLLKIISGEEPADTGSVSARRGLKICYVGQADHFPTGATIASVLKESLSKSSLEPHEIEFEIGKMVGIVGFDDADTMVETLSGGWRKRVSIASALIQQPDILILDEPTNHLDLQGILWLERLLTEASFALIVVTHDRYFLENVTNRIIELNKRYAEGFLSINGPYSKFLEEKEAHLAGQLHRQAALESIVRKEVDWLRRNPQARTTKADYRIREAHKLISDLADVKHRNNLAQAAGIDFSSSLRKTRELLTAKGISKSLGGKLLFEKLNLVFSPNTRLGLLGVNGSGKTTLLKILMGELSPDTGEIKESDDLRRVYFDQKRSPLDVDATLRQALCPLGDTVIYNGQSMHVAAWAKRMLFPVDQLEMPVSSLSGGEQARVLLAKMMLQQADILILDEPTNDLDIPSLEILEEAISNFEGAVILVSHDRYLLDRVSTEILALDGNGGHSVVASYSQWESLTTPAKQKPTSNSSASSEVVVEKKVRLNAAERKELLNMEATILEAEDVLAQLERDLVSDAVATNPSALNDCWNSIEKAKERIAGLYNRWEELEQRR